MQYEEDYEFECPYCGEGLSVHIDRTAGRRQSFTQDCEVCCQPIAIKLVLDSDGVIEFSADQEQ